MTTPLELATAELEAANAPAGENPVRIGILTPMTPPGDDMAGVLVTRGARLGVEYLAEHGGVLGRGVELVARNDMATADADGFGASAAGETAKLALVDEVVAVLGQWHLRTAGWAAEVCERFGLPMFVENGHSTITHGRKSIFRTYFSCADRTPLMVDYMAAQGAKRVAVLAADTVFGQEMADAVVAYGTEHHGMEFLRIDFAQQEVLDWRADLERIAAWQPDFFVNDGVNVAADGKPPGNAYRITQQATEVGLLPAVPMMVTFGFPMRSADYWNYAGDAGNGVVWPASRFRPAWPGMTGIGRWFTERFTERFGMAPPDTSLSAFTDVTIIGAALNAAAEKGELPSEISGIRKALIESLETHAFDTWRGPVRFDPADHHSSPELVLMQYQEVGQSFNDAAVVHPAEVQGT
ncbi:transporter [Actinorhabdospora filicis]|uniref:Transporter n=1 Tax=Actinorhabdospora filicis TaxID=1785913 RepID=A0A9W6SLS8_9ACTN|nr:ABC transporter substrate-binding protein [Actinorhabdospora filicis]GLZ78267.1 transporter [Actinorhabdospora filicis]